MKSIDGKGVNEIEQDFLPYFDVGNELSNHRNMAQLLTYRRFNLPDNDHSFFELVNTTPSRGNAVKSHTFDLYWEIEDGLPSYAQHHQAFAGNGSNSPHTAIAMEATIAKQRQEYARKMSALLAKHPGSSRSELEARLQDEVFDAYRPKYEATLVEHFQAMEVIPDSSCQMASGVSEPLPIPGYVFRYGPYMLGLVRIPDYTPSIVGKGYAEAIDAYSESYRCLLEKMSKTVDGLIIDQTNNGGGYLEYMNRLSQLFIDGSGPGTAHYIPTDRKWQRQFSDAARYAETVAPGSYETNFYRSIYRQLVNAARAGESRIGPISLSGAFRTLNEDKAFTFLKPVVVAIDSLDASSADAFPEVMKRNGHLLFGERTMGAGGCVEMSDPLTNSQYGMSMTRSMFFGDAQNDEEVADETFIENNGVQPDVEYSLQAADLVAPVQFTQYIQALADTTVSHIESKHDSEKKEE